MWPQGSRTSKTPSEKEQQQIEQSPQSFLIAWERGSWEMACSEIRGRESSKVPAIIVAIVAAENPSVKLFGI